MVTSYPSTKSLSYFYLSSRLDISNLVSCSDFSSIDRLVLNLTMYNLTSYRIDINYINCTTVVTTSASAFSVDPNVVLTRVIIYYKFIIPLKSQNILYLQSITESIQQKVNASVTSGKLVNMLKSTSNLYGTAFYNGIIINKVIFLPPFAVPTSTPTRLPTAVADAQSSSLVSSGTLYIVIIVPILVLLVCCIALYFYNYPMDTNYENMNAMVYAPGKHLMSDDLLDVDFGKVYEEDEVVMLARMASDNPMSTRDFGMGLRTLSPNLDENPFSTSYKDDAIPYGSSKLEKSPITSYNDNPLSVTNSTVHYVL